MNVQFAGLSGLGQKKLSVYTSVAGESRDQLQKQLSDDLKALVEPFENEAKAARKAKEDLSVTQMAAAYLELNRIRTEAEQRVNELPAYAVHQKQQLKAYNEYRVRRSAAVMAQYVPDEKLMAVLHKLNKAEEDVPDLISDTLIQKLHIRLNKDQRRLYKQFYKQAQ